MRIPKPAQGLGSEVSFPDHRSSTADSHFNGQLGRIVDGNQNDERCRVPRAEPTGCLDPIHVRHADVQEDELRMQLGRQDECFLARGCLAQRFETVGCSDHVERRAPEVGLIVDHQDTDCLRPPKQS